MNNHGTFHFVGTVSMVIADNLAAHEIAGFMESFSSFRCCRFCSATKESMQTCFEEKSLELRSKATYSARIGVVPNNPELSNVYGLKKESCLNDLKYFHICWGSPSDVAHDIFEGFC